MIIDGIENTIAALIGLDIRRIDMEKLDSFEKEMQEDVSELKDTKDVRERLQEELGEIDNRLDEILDKLSDLEGDAAESVKQELTDEKEKKSKEIEEKARTIESKEQELNEKIKMLEESLIERKDALSKVQDLGRTADIDVSDAVGEINDEINRLEEDKQTILDNLRK